MKTSSVRAALATASAVLFTTSATVAAVSDLASLRTELDENGKGEEFAMIRCAGFYLSVLNYTGVDKLSEDTVSQSKMTIEQLLDRARELRETADQTGTDDKLIQAVLEVSNTYISRYQMNFEADGNAFSTDPVWNSDSDTCSIVRMSVMP